MVDEPAKKRSLNFETIGSVVAMVIGVCALFVAWDQAQVMRKQQHASVIPIINIGGGFSTSGGANTMTISFQNDGIGPAIVESATLAIDGREVSDWPDLRDRFLPERLKEGFHSSLDTSIGVLAAGERTDAILITWPSDEITDAAFGELKSKVFSSSGQSAVFSVCYCSVFDRCWRAGSGADAGAKPASVKKCDDAGEDVVARLLQTILEENE
jgi:hypothetical protein